jgi:hypothetical protein
MKLTLMTILLSLIVSCGKNINGENKPVYGSSDEVVLNQDDILTNYSNTRSDEGAFTATAPAPSSSPTPTVNNASLTDPIRDTSGSNQNGSGQGQSTSRVSFVIRMDNSEVNEGASFIVHLANTGEAPIDVALLNNIEDSLYSYENNNCGQMIQTNQSCSFFYQARLIQQSDTTGVLTNLTISYSSPVQTAQASINVRFKNLDYVASTNTGGSGYSEAELNTYLVDNRHTVRDCINKEYYGSKGQPVFNMEDYRMYCQFRSFDYNVGYQPRVETKLTVNHIQNALVNGELQDSYFCPGDWNIADLRYDKARVKEHYFFGVRWKDVTDPDGESICTDYSQIRLKCVKRETLFPRLVKVNCY